MSCEAVVDVRYHQQESSFYCGPTCAQMVLQSIGGGLLDQDDLWNQIHDYASADPSSIGWKSAPDCLAWALNGLRPAGYPISIDLHAVTSTGVLSRKIIWSIHQHHLPAIVLTSGMSHWIVVRGFTTSAAPASAGDTSYSILSLDINNSTVVPYAPPPPHSDVDLCGSGGDRGLAENNLSYSHWCSAYLHPVTSGGWTCKFLAICDPDPPPLFGGMVATTSTPENGTQILSQQRAKDLAIAAISQYGLETRTSWAPFLRGAKPGPPVLVQRLDRLDSFYYIVPMQNGPAVPVLVSVDARFGSYLEAGRTAQPQNNALSGLNFAPTWAEQQVVGSKIDLRSGGRVTIRKEAFALYPTLVWRPCRESQSPFLPFFMVIVGGQRLYLRVDGRLFTRLHTGDVA
jgi:hypothetical protein